MYSKILITTDGSENSEKATSIYYKTIAYMYRFSSNNGFLIFPKQDKSFLKTYRIKETDGILKKIFTLDPATVVFPGHGPATTVGHEVANNPYVEG